MFNKERRAASDFCSWDRDHSHRVTRDVPLFRVAAISRFAPSTLLGLSESMSLQNDSSGLLGNGSNPSASDIPVSPALIHTLAEVLAIYPLISHYDEADLAEPALAVKRRLETVLNKASFGRSDDLVSS